MIILNWKSKTLDTEYFRLHTGKLFFQGQNSGNMEVSFPTFALVVNHIKERGSYSTPQNRISHLNISHKTSDLEADIYIYL